MPQETIFSQIIRREAPGDIVYQDDLVTAFRDIHPQAPVHILIVPNKLIPTANDVTAADEPVLGHMFTVAARVAAQEGIAESGYRLLVNCNVTAARRSITSTCISLVAAPWDRC